MNRKIGTAQLLVALKAAGESTRLRILALLSKGELNVTDLTHILSQSQPRISRHLRLLSEAGLIERFREGSFVYCRLNEYASMAGLINDAVASLDRNDPVLKTDFERAAKIKTEREKASQIWFRANAAEWDQIRSLHVAESEVEETMQSMLGDDRCDLLLDLGTGTGRVLELFADKARQAIGIDSSHSMLDYARSRLAYPGFEHCQVRQGDLSELAYENDIADVVILHQVLHFLVEPKQAVAEASRILKPGGQLLIVDFAPHDLDFLRDEFAHERLGFSKDQMTGWLSRAGLEIEQFRQLKAPQEKGEQKLTVSIWCSSHKNSEQNERKSSAQTDGGIAYA